MTNEQYIEKLKKIHDDMWNTVEPDEMRELENKEIETVENMLKEYYGYIRPQERE